VRHDEKATRAGCTEREVAQLVPRMIGIVERQGQGVSEDAGGFLEGNAVLRKVGRRLRGIPLEFHGVPKLARVGQSRAQSTPPNTYQARPRQGAVGFPAAAHERAAGAEPSRARSSSSASDFVSRIGAESATLHPTPIEAFSPTRGEAGTEVPAA
jgi:hypothetical protein